MADPQEMVRNAFDKQSRIFDALYSPNPIIQYKRQRVRELVLRYIRPGQKILELNAGTGEDAVFFAQTAIFVHATDISEGMQTILADKVRKHNLQNFVTNEVCSFTELDQLQDRGPYDLIFSNFAGLNCTADLEKVLHSFAPLLNERGMAILVLLPKFCLWETLLALRGNFKTAFRRFFSKKGTHAQIEGVHFTCWYYDPSFIIHILKGSFDVLGTEGLCTLVPPSYLETFPIKFPNLYRQLIKYENRLKNKWPWKGIGDYYIISLKKKG